MYQLSKRVVKAECRCLLSARHQPPVEKEMIIGLYLTLCMIHEGAKKGGGWARGLVGGMGKRPQKKGRRGKKGGSRERKEKKGEEGKKNGGRRAKWKRGKEEKKRDE